MAAPDPEVRNPSAEDHDEDESALAAADPDSPGAALVGDEPDEIPEPNEPG